jgi:hypothetical protein
LFVNFANSNYGMRISFFVVACLWIAVVNVFGQNKILEEVITESEWSEGTIAMNDGTELKGLLRFDDRLAILAYQNGNDSRTMTPQSVTAFNFFDPSSEKQRSFYTLDYEDPVQGRKRPYFFEVLIEFKTFAVISKIDAIKMKGDVGFDNLIDNSYKADIRQTETIFFLNDQGAIEPYLQVMRKLVDRIMYDYKRTKAAIIDKKILDRYFTKEEIDKMETYAVQNELNIKVKEDFVKMLEYCLSLRTN